MRTLGDRGESLEIGMDLLLKEVLNLTGVFHEWDEQATVSTGKVEWRAFKRALAKVEAATKRVESTLYGA